MLVLLLALYCIINPLFGGADMKIVSVDPGKSGAVSVFEDKKLIEVFDLDYIDVGGEDFLVTKHIADVDYVVIEKVGAMKGQGVSSMFSFGSRFGEAKAYALTLVPANKIIFVRPQKWKKALGLIGSDKKDSAVLAAKVYPDCKELFLEPNKRCKDGVKYHDGRGDSACIGLAAIKLGLLK